MIESASNKHRPNRDITCQAEIFWLEDFVCAWVIEDSFGVNACLVGKCTITTVALRVNKFDRAMKPGFDTRDRVHERNVDFNCLSNKVFNLSEHGQIILGLDIFWVGRIETCD